jgi:dedicator of cytokinesis protein 3
MVTKLQEWHSSPVIFDDASLKAQEEDNLEYCLTLLPRYVKARVFTRS